MLKSLYLKNLLRATTPAVGGSDTFPATANEFYTAVETIAVQNIRNVKNTNQIENGFYEYEVDGNGNVIEEAIIEMAQRQNFVDTGSPDFSPSDPTLHVKYFNNFVKNTFKTTTRKEEIRTIVANKGTTPEEVASGIMDSLTQGEGNYDYEQMRDILKNTQVGYDASAALFNNKVPANMKGVLYCLRDMYNAVKATNTIGTALTSVKQSCPAGDVKIAISEDVLNMVDVVELANLFNLSKEDLFGQLVVVPKDSAYTPSRVVVYDAKALGRATRYYTYDMDHIGAGLYDNHYLHTCRGYFYNPLFKCLYLNISTAITQALGTLLTD